MIRTRARHHHIIQERIHSIQHQINIIDTPGTPTLGRLSESNMADGAFCRRRFEGPMPQTVLFAKALEIGLKPILVINKVDKPNCRPEEVQRR